MKRSAFEVHAEFVIQPYQHGVRLVRPHGDEAGISVAQMNHLSVQTAFTNRDHQFMAMNKLCLQVLGAGGERDCLGKTPAYFTNKEFGLQVLRNFDAVLGAESMQVIEEVGRRHDDMPIQSIVFRLPWYFDDKVIGLYSIALLIDPASMSGFAENMSQLLSTGLVNAYRPAMQQKKSVNHFTEREQEVLQHLVVGLTAKKIAEILRISPRTVEHHIENMRDKTGSANRVELISKYALLTQEQGVR